MSSRILAMTIATLAAAVALVGCGEDGPRFDPSTTYSPGSLAQEFAFRYKSLDRSKPAVAAGKPDGAPTKGGAVAKGGAVTKAAPARTLDALLDDVIAKAALIPGRSRADACKEVAREVANDPAFSQADRKAIADRLGQVAD